THVPVTVHLRETAHVYAATASTPAPALDPSTDVDALEALEEEIVVLAAHLHAAEHRFLTLVAEYDRRQGWKLAGHRSCAHWLAFRCGYDPGTARERVRAARALAVLPKTSAAMSRGELSFSKVRALSRVATPENETGLLDLARGSTAAQLEEMVRGFKLGSRQAEVDREKERSERRSFSVFPDEEGMYVVKGLVTPEVGALLMRAVEAAGDALYREKGAKSVSYEASPREGARRRADALALVAGRALAAGFDSSADSSARAPLSGTRAERYQVLLHVDTETLSEDGGLGQSELEDGTRVSAETSRRLACDASVVRIGHASDRSVLDVGRKRRTIPPAVRRALEVRDRGCRFPGCGLRFTDAHHIRHWADGGETKLENLMLLCSYHHRLLHEEGWKVEWWGKDRQPAFMDPRGHTHVGRPREAPALEPDPVKALIEDTRRRGADPDFYTPGARWKREADIPDEVYFKAKEAIGGW
ncbi:MAG: DUF222 domain-containing protein, partial [Candidatus Palauibacterales bacterium]|nr:DUF222 domain-containing protein [Candidatus Palauibacterales bacterium]